MMVPLSPTTQMSLALVPQTSVRSIEAGAGEVPAGERFYQRSKVVGLKIAALAIEPFEPVSAGHVCPCPCPSLSAGNGLT